MSAHHPKTTNRLRNRPGVAIRKKAHQLRLASREPQSQEHSATTVASCRGDTLARQRPVSRKLWRIEHAPPMPTSRCLLRFGCFAVAGATASAAIAALRSRDLPPARL
nr:unnamed protein product [Digitaria exilis]